MGEHEQRFHFERLLALRERYRRADHRAGDLTVDDAIAYGEALLAGDIALDAVLAAEAPDSTGRTSQT